MKKKVIGRIKWYVVIAKVKDIQKTPSNYKIATELGMRMLEGSLGLFGLAGTIICTWAGKYGDKTKLILVDGNSRHTKAVDDGEKTIQVSVPDRKLTPAQFIEMAAMYDRARAGEVDSERIDAELGKTSDFFSKYGMSVPMGKLAGMGANADQSLQFPDKQGKQAEPVINQLQVMLFFEPKEEVLFKKMEEKLKKRFKTGNTTDTVFKAFKHLCK